MKFDRIAQRRGWSKKNKDNFNSLKQELALRFDLRDEPIAARHRLHLAKQDDDESLEAYLQKILTITMDEYKTPEQALSKRWSHNHSCVTASVKMQPRQL